MEHLASAFFEGIKALGCQFSKDYPMSNVTTFKIGGNADVLIWPQNISQLKGIISACKAYCLPYMVMGNGSNMLVSDKGINGAVINLGANFADVKLVDEFTIYACAGVSLSKLSSFAAKHSLTGLEFCYGIPGNVGGGIFMNAGAYGGEFKDVTSKVYHLDCDLIEGSFSAEQANMQYRHTAYHENKFVITGGLFKLEKGDKEQIEACMADFMNQRSSKQPLELPSAGSTFKRPKGAFAAALIDNCGLKGMSVGGAAVSTKHCGFVVNTGGATCKDVLELTREVKKIVLKETGFTLELELKVIGVQD